MPGELLLKVAIDMGIGTPYTSELVAGKNRLKTHTTTINLKYHEHFCRKNIDDYRRYR